MVDTNEINNLKTRIAKAMENGDLTTIKKLEREYTSFFENNKLEAQHDKNRYLEQLKAAENFKDIMEDPTNPRKKDFAYFLQIVNQLREFLGKEKLPDKPEDFKVDLKEFACSLGLDKFKTEVSELIEKEKLKKPLQTLFEEYKTETSKNPIYSGRQTKAFQTWVKSKNYEIATV